MLYDADIREPLFDFLEETYGKTRIIEEKNIGNSRADVVMVTEHGLYGLEIKSDADTYARLSGQVRDYDLTWDYNYVVAGSRHAGSVESHVPSYWGIITVDETVSGPDFYILRKPEPNPKMKLKNKLGVLWRPELVHLQELHEMPRYKERSKEFVIDRIVERAGYPPEKKGAIDPQMLSREISTELFERDYTEIAAVIRAYRKAERGKRKKTSGTGRKKTARRKRTQSVMEILSRLK